MGNFCHTPKRVSPAPSFCPLSPYLSSPPQHSTPSHDKQALCEPSERVKSGQRVKGSKERLQEVREGSKHDKWLSAYKWSRVVRLPYKRSGVERGSKNLYSFA